MKKLLVLSFVILLLFTGCTGTMEDQPSETTTVETTPSVEDFAVRFEGENTCVLYNTETGEDVVTTEQEGFYNGCEIVNTYGDKIYYTLDPDGMGGYILFGWASLWDTYYYDVVTGKTGEIEGNIISFSEDGRYAAMQEINEDTHRIALLDFEDDTTSYFIVADEYLQFGNTNILNDGQTLVYGAALGNPSDEKMSIIIHNLGEEPVEIISMSSTWYSITGVDGDTILLEKQLSGGDYANCTVQMDGSDLDCQISIKIK